MSTKPLLSGEILVEVSHRRYDELVAKEERLRLIEAVLRKKDNYENINDIKLIFDLPTPTKEAPDECKGE